MRLRQLKIVNHPILGNVSISFINPKTNRPYSLIAFVGENGCGKTTLLNEIFNYSKSPNVVRDDDMPESFNGLFIHQDSLFTGAMNELYKVITGREGPYPSTSGEFVGGENPLGLRINAAINNPNEGAEIVAAFDDEKMLEAYRSGSIRDLSCAGQVDRVITGRQAEFDASTLSSGQGEILLKIKSLQQAKVGTDVLLLDEPETSLHPRWQEIILDAVKNLVSGKDIEGPQIFVATHSERVLESLTRSGDAMIVRLYRKDGKTCVETIDEMGLSLPMATYAELDYVVFKMPSYEYNDQLLMRFADIIGKQTFSDIDKAIRQDPHYQKDIHRKIWTFFQGVEKKYRTLPVYIRHWFHHTNEGKPEPSKEELIRSIELLRVLVKEPSIVV